MTVTSEVRHLDARLLRDVLGHYPTGIAVITAIADDGLPVAMTVGTFTSVSLDPPLVGFLPAKSSQTFARLRTATGFCVNVLAADQEVLCRAFASSSGDRFAGVSWSPSPGGSPIIEGCVAWIDTTLEDVVEVGDHYLVTGRVRDLEVTDGGLPLLYFERGYCRFTPLQFVHRSPARLIPVIGAVEAARPTLDRLAEEAGCEVVVTVPVDDQIVHVAAVGSTSMHPSALVGRRLPWAPPIGALLAMDAAPEVRDAWLARSSRASDPGDREELLAQLDRAREAGGVLSRKSPRHDELDVMLDAIAHDVHTPAQGREVLSILDELRESSYDRGTGAPADEAAATVRLLAVPVRGHDGGVPFQIGFHDLDLRADDPRLAELRAVLVAAADTISGLPATRALGAGPTAGSAPDDLHPRHEGDHDEA
jgi:flavin reductase (DIM6/NTAB) family NADH-FMN oxidoreductase RutF/DNA-binding IclR family transcriptional regulator